MKPALRVVTSRDTALPPVTERTKRPIFLGRRFVVHEWQLNDLERMLGAHFVDFDCHEWFFELDARTVQSGEVVPQRDGGAWLQARTLEEAHRRRLPMASAKPVLQRQPVMLGTTCPHEPRCERSRDCTRRIINEGRAERGVPLLADE